VKKAGQIVLHGADRFIGYAFRVVDVGFEPIKSDQFLVHAGPLVIGAIRRQTKEPMQPIASLQLK
jgi:hypothetical protein